MNVIRWQHPAHSLWTQINGVSDLREEIDRLFEAPLAELTRTSDILSGRTPRLDMFQDRENVYVKADLPGMSKDDIDISLQEDTLSISGERKANDKSQEAELLRAERFVGQFQRTVTLPAPVAVQEVKAHYKDGVLTITLPKTEEAKPRQIDVQVS
jgi:HSP20 family protein